MPIWRSNRGVVPAANESVHSIADQYAGRSERVSEEVDLTDHLTLMITRVLKAKEVFELGKAVGKGL